MLSHPAHHRLCHKKVLCIRKRNGERTRAWEPRRETHCRRVAKAGASGRKRRQATFLKQTPKGFTGCLALAMASGQNRESQDPLMVCYPHESIGATELGCFDEGYCGGVMLFSEERSL
jgi:hypothetical protein